MSQDIGYEIKCAYFTLTIRTCHGEARGASGPKIIRGMTLIEVIIYIVLLSFLISGFIQYVYSIHEQNIKLMQDLDYAYTS